MKKNIVDRIAALEILHQPTDTRTFWWCDDDEDDLEVALSKHRQRTGFEGSYSVIVTGVSGRWEERAGIPHWVRPDNAAHRYLHAAPPMTMDPRERHAKQGASALDHARCLNTAKAEESSTSQSVAECSGMSPIDPTLSRLYS